VTSKIDKVLDDIRKSIELYGRSGWETIYKDNVVFTLPGGEFEPPIDSDIDGAVVDFDWFLKCAKDGCGKPHPSPEKSFWMRFWGKSAEPYGRSWNFNSLYKALEDPAAYRRAVLYNPTSSSEPPCIQCYHFQQLDHNTLDITVMMRSSDVAKVLPQDVLMTWFLQKYVSEQVGLQRGKMTFFISNAHIFYEDLEFPEEHSIDTSL